jgi:hypothetical protein
LSFAPCYSQSPLKLCLDIYISSNSRNLIQFLEVNLPKTVKEKRENPDKNHTPLHIVNEIHIETSSSTTLKIMLRNLNKIVRS